MSSNPEHLIREAVVSHLSGSTNLDKLDSTICNFIWNTDLTMYPEAEELAYDIELLLAEYSHGHWTKGGLERELKNLVILLRPHAIYMLENRGMSTATDNITITSSYVSDSPAFSSPFFEQLPDQGHPFYKLSQTAS